VDVDREVEGTGAAGTADSADGVSAAGQLGVAQVSLPARSNSPQPQKPPVPPKSSQKPGVGLLQLNEMPIYHMSCPAPPP
jgi:hypothetical protein